LRLLCRRVLIKDVCPPRSRLRTPADISGIASDIFDALLLAWAMRSVADYGRCFLWCRRWVRKLAILYPPFSRACWRRQHSVAARGTPDGRRGFSGSIAKTHAAGGRLLFGTRLLPWRRRDALAGGRRRLSRQPLLFLCHCLHVPFSRWTKDFCSFYVSPPIRACVAGDLYSLCSLVPSTLPFPAIVRCIPCGVTFVPRCCRDLRAWRLCTCLAT